MSGISALPHHLQRRLQAELKAGESLVWVGQPNPGRAMKGAFKIWYFFVPWTAISLFILSQDDGNAFSWRDGNSVGLLLLGGAFPLVGMLGMCLPWWIRSRARLTIYAITDQRALMIEGTRSITVKSFLATHLGGVQKVRHADGSGDLILRVEHYKDGDGDAQTRQEGFFNLDDVQSVERLIEKLMKGQTSWATPAF